MPRIIANKTVYYVSVGDSWEPPTLFAVDSSGNSYDVDYYGVYDTSISNEYIFTYYIENSKGRAEVDIYLYVYSDQPSPSDYPEMDDSKLTTIISRWTTERNKLKVKYPLENFGIFDYYSSLDGLDGEDFFQELKEIITVTQVTYGEVRFILEESDAKHSVWGTYMHGMYDSKKLIRYWDSVVSDTMDREHVWPKSYLTVTSVDNSHRNIASDAHNLRIILKNTNSSRGNRYFVEGSGPIGYNIGSNAYYPGDDHRGDVARIMFYMHVRYSEDIFLTNSSSDIVNYKNNKTKINGKIPFGLLDVLLQWHELDPPDEFEIQRNNAIYKYQGNRNPFIDHPEYVSVIFNVQTTNGQTIEVEVMFVNTDLNLDDLNNNYKKYFN